MSKAVPTARHRPLLRPAYPRSSWKARGNGRRECYPARITEARLLAEDLPWAGVPVAAEPP